MPDPRYEILFTPVPSGRPMARNRLPQVDHCNGGGYRDPFAAARMRGIEAAGGWGVILTELRLREDRLIPQLRRMSDRMKTHGSLAGIRPACSGMDGPNLHIREIPLDARGIEIVLNRGIARIEPDHVAGICVHPGRTRPIPAGAVVPVTSRPSDDRLHRNLMARQADRADAGISSVGVVHDAGSPGPLAGATRAGHRHASERDRPDRGDARPLRRQITRLVAR